MYNTQESNRKETGNEMSSGIMASDPKPWTLNPKPKPFAEASVL